MNEKDRADIENFLREMPQPVIQAFGWLVDNIDFIDLLSEQKPVPQKELMKYQEKAREKSDYLLLVLVMYIQARGTMPQN